MSSLKQKAISAIGFITGNMLKRSQNSLGIKTPQQFELNSPRWKNTNASDTNQIAIKTCRNQMRIAERIGKENKN
jgi:hypothetical protein